MPDTANNAPSSEVLSKECRIFIAGHRGMVGSAILRSLTDAGYKHLIVRTHTELDLLDQRAVRKFFADIPIDYVILAAAKVGGIHANNSYPADFIYQNLMIEANVIEAAFRNGVDRLLFLGSSCIYPKHAPQPIREEDLLSGHLEPTNAPYAIAKIAGIKLCESYNRQHGTHYRAVMPTNLYGPNDSFDLENSHVLPALIRKYHLAKLAAGSDREESIERDALVFGPLPDDIREALQVPKESRGDNAAATGPVVRLWGSGSPHREFLHVDDLASACITIMGLPDEDYRRLCRLEPRLSEGNDDSATEPDLSASARVSHINIGVGTDLRIRELAEIVSSAVGYEGETVWDTSKPDGTPRKLLDVSRLKRTGWTPRISLAEGIHSTYRWYLEKSAAG
ncbi:MAG: GDP-L-fucose synthase [Desulfobacterales bacterium]